jgi:hypothetical protein
MRTTAAGGRARPWTPARPGRTTRHRSPPGRWVAACASQGHTIRPVGGVSVAWRVVRPSARLRRPVRRPRGSVRPVPPAAPLRRRLLGWVGVAWALPPAVPAPWAVRRTGAGTARSDVFDLLLRIPMKGRTRQGLGRAGSRAFDLMLLIPTKGRTRRVRHAPAGPRTPAKASRVRGAAGGSVGVRRPRRGPGGGPVGPPSLPSPGAAGRTERPTKTSPADEQPTAKARRSPGQPAAEVRSLAVGRPGVGP